MDFDHPVRLGTGLFDPEINHVQFAHHRPRQPPGASNDEVRQLADQIHAQQVLTSHLGASTTLPAAIPGMAT